MVGMIMAEISCDISKSTEEVGDLDINVPSLLAPMLQSSSMFMLRHITFPGTGAM